MLFISLFSTVVIIYHIITIITKYFIFKNYFFCIVRNLDETTKSVYKENVRLSESLNYHMKEGDMLKHERQRLSEQNEKLMSQKELSDTLVQEKVIQAKQHKETIKGVNKSWTNLTDTAEQCTFHNNNLHHFLLSLSL